MLEKYRYVHYPPTKLPNFELDIEKCTHCKACFKACPTSCIQWDEEKNLPYATGLGAMELACIACNCCEAVCPANAVKVRGEYKVLRGRYKTPDDKPTEMTPPIPFGKENSTKNFEDIEQNLTEVEKTIYRRRSIRLFKDKPMPKELINRIIEAARWAPSSGNCQPWKFIVVTNKELNRKIEQQSMKILDAIKWIYAKKSLWRKIVVSLVSYLQVNNMDQRPIPPIEKAHQLDGVFTWGAPVVIYILKDTRGIGNPDLDTGLAAQNLVLAAHSLGLGTCFVGLTCNAMKYLPHLRKELGIKYPYELVTSVCVGYPKGKLDNPVYRSGVSAEWIE